MKSGTDILVQSLLINDREEVYDNRQPLVEPRKAIGELARKGDSVIPALTLLIERYEKEKERRNYIDYVIEILGRIGGERTTVLILRILLASLASDDDSADTCVAWLRKSGKVAVPAIIRFVDENYGATFAVMCAADALEEIKDGRLVPLLMKLLKYPNPQIVQSALISLRKQDDKSTVPQIIPLLQYQDENPAEQRQTREFALAALEFLLRDDQLRLREIRSDLKSRPRGSQRGPSGEPTGPRSHGHI